MNLEHSDIINGIKVHMICNTHLKRRKKSQYVIISSVFYSIIFIKYQLYVYSTKLIFFFFEHCMNYKVVSKE